MTIFDNRRNLVEYFTVLDFGDVFLFDGTFYMKIPLVNNNANYPQNAFNLETGYLAYFDGQDEVNVVNAELVIKD